MNWSFVIRQKVKAATLLCCIIVVIVLSSLRMNQAIQAMDQSIESVYADRLQPAVDLVYLSENLHAKRLLLQSYLGGHTLLSLQDLKAHLIDYDNRNYNLICAFEKTKLTDVEAQKLIAFKTGLTAYARLEDNVLELTQANEHQRAISMFEIQGANIFHKEVVTLHAMAKIQSVTGENAVKSAHRQAAGGSINNSLIIAISVIIGLTLIGLLRSEKLTDQRSELFNLN